MVPIPEIDPHVDLGGYLLGRLSDDERAPIDAHLATCPRCTQEVENLGPMVGSLDAAMRGPQPPHDLEARVIAAVARAAEQDRVASTRPRRVRRGWAAGLVAAALAASVVVAFVVGGRILDGDTTSSPVGDLELAAGLSGSGGTASVQVRKVGVGRTVHLRSDVLPILPKGQYYQLWFVGPDDVSGARQRITAGTFHPDDQGRVDATFTAAVDPARFPVISVSMQTGPRAKRPGPEVLRTPAP